MGTSKIRVVRDGAVAVFSTGPAIRNVTANLITEIIGTFLLVFGIQEGETYDWGTITGFISVPLLIAAGVVVLAAFLVWQARNRREPLVPLGLGFGRGDRLAVRRL